MLGADPPRRPPHRNPLTRSKSCHGPTRRKRGREVLEDITWIVNHPSSWQNDTSAGPSTFNNNDREDGTLGAHLEELAVVPQRLPLAGPSSAPSARAAASASTTRRAVNMARARSDTSLVLINTNDSEINNINRLHLNGLLNAPRASTSRITNLDSSSPPSSPHASSRYGFANVSSNAGCPSSTRGSSLNRAATMPFLTPTSSSNGLPLSRPPSRAPSPSLRAPPPLRRSNSSSSVSSMNGDTTASSSSPLNTPSTLPMMLSSAFSAGSSTGSNGGSRGLTRARTIPAYTAEGLDDPAQEETTGEITRILPIPTIQREMPSPERKRSRRGGRVIIDDEDEDVDDSSDSE